LNLELLLLSEGLFVHLVESAKSNLIEIVIRVDKSLGGIVDIVEWLSVDLREAGATAEAHSVIEHTPNFDA